MQYTIDAVVRENAVFSFFQSVFQLIPFYPDHPLPCAFRQGTGGIIWQRKAKKMSLSSIGPTIHTFRLFANKGETIGAIGKIFFNEVKKSLALLSPRPGALTY